MKINVVLYNPEIPQNTGNIMRTCAATNTHLHLIKPLGFSLDEKNMKRSAASYAVDTVYTIYENFDDFLMKNPDRKLIFITRYGNKTPKELDYNNVKEDIYFVFGSESSGMPKEILSKYHDDCYRLPMNENVRSLNLSNVCAIMVYDYLKSNSYEGLSIHEPEILKGKDYLLK